jgi:hypothetical protein
MRLHLAALGLLLVTGCAAGHQTASLGSHQPTGIAVPAGQSDSRTPSSTPATTVPSTAAPSPSASTAGSTAPARPATQRVVIRPVTATGRLAPGYTLVARQAADQLSCGGSAYPTEPSQVAVDDGIAYCSPSAAYAVACWPGPTHNTALCFGNPWQRQVDQLSTEGPLTGVSAPRNPSPLGLELSDGTRCSLRDGGAWGELDQHPELVGTYYCTGDLAVWANGHSDGIDRSSPTWTVRLAPMSGHGTLRPVTVHTAYYVGTATA